MNAQSLGSLRNGWSATLDDCAISGGWTSEGNEFAVVDAAGSVSVFDGNLVTLFGQKRRCMMVELSLHLFIQAKVNLQPQAKMVVSLFGIYWNLIQRK